MICPILESIEVIDSIAEKMDYFMVRWVAGRHIELIDEMREFFSESFWDTHRMTCRDREDYLIFNETKEFISRAERSMDNIIAIWQAREIKMVKDRLVTRLRSTV